VADFRLSERAEQDLIQIYDYTEETFGPYQADAYHSGLEHTFGLLADFPVLGGQRTKSCPGFADLVFRLIRCFTPKRQRSF
jgi:toxin ParE1/3/4